MSALPRPAVRLTSSDVSFVPMTEADLDWVAASEKVIYPFPWSRTNFADSLSAGYSSWLVHYAGAPAGYAVVMVVLDEAHVLNVSILPTLQGHGLGSLMLNKLREVARAAGAMQIFLEVRASNQRAQTFYLKSGFVLINRRKAYYPAHEGREDALVMRREL